jgi:acyl-CoA thioesterase FadM
MKLDLPAARKLVFTLAIPIRWGDMDAMGLEVSVHERVR